MKSKLNIRTATALAVACSALLCRVEPLIKKWNDEADKLDEDVKKLEAVRSMIAKEALEPEITWRSIQSTTWRRCAIHLKMQTDAHQHDITMAGYEKDRLVRELKSQGRESEIDPAA